MTCPMVMVSASRRRASSLSYQCLEKSFEKFYGIGLDRLRQGALAWWHTVTHDNARGEKADMAKAKGPTVYLTSEAAAALGSRSLSQFANQTLPRLRAAAGDIEISDFDRQFYRLHAARQLSGPYPDQCDIVRKFAKATGMSMAECVVRLDAIEYEIEQARAAL